MSWSEGGLRCSKCRRYRRLRLERQGVNSRETSLTTAGLARSLRRSRLRCGRSRARESRS